MSQSMKIVAALVFVTVVGWVLLQPVFDAMDPEVTSGRDRTSRAASTDRSGAPDDAAPEPEPLPDAFRTERLLEPFPDVCLRRTRAFSDVIAVERGDRLAAGRLGGDLQEFTAAGLAGVSVNGRVAFQERDRGMAVVNLDADAITPLTYARDLVWSPVSPCGVVVAKQGAGLSVLPSRRPLVRADVRAAAFSADGRNLAIVVNGDRATTIWVASLERGELREVVRQQPGSRIGLRGWGADGKTVFYAEGGGGLAFVTTSDPPQSGRIAADPVEQLERCGDRLLGIFRGRIVQITKLGPQYLTRPRDGYLYLSCSPNGEFIAAIGSDGLVLLDGKGTLLRDLVDDTGYTDVFVDWGDDGAGVIFGRVRSDPDAAELWHIAEGGSARPTGITYRGGARAVDWGASPPTGLP